MKKLVFRHDVMLPRWIPITIFSLVVLTLPYTVLSLTSIIKTASVLFLWVGYMSTLISIFVIWGNIRLRRQGVIRIYDDSVLELEENFRTQNFRLVEMESVTIDRRENFNNRTMNVDQHRNWAARGDVTVFTLTPRDHSHSTFSFATKMETKKKEKLVSLLTEMKIKVI